MTDQTSGTAAAGHEQQAHLAHHFETPQQQFHAGKLGMWLFLATEVVLFGGLFCAYAVYRSNHPEIFQYAHQYLDKTLGAVNTTVLICSSLTMAWGVRCAQRGQKRGLIICLLLTLACACGFLGIKYVEYQHKWKEGLLWGTRFDPAHPPGVHGDESEAESPTYDALLGTQSAEGPRDRGTKGPGDQGTGGPGDQETGKSTQHSALSTQHSADHRRDAGATRAAEPPAVEVERSKILPAADGPSGLAAQPSPSGATEQHGILNRPSNVHIFFGIYFAMTGLHGLHILAGMSVITWILIRSIKGHFGPTYYAPVDFVGLYWHLVDLIWIYLFPLLYLIH